MVSDITDDISNDITDDIIQLYVLQMSDAF